MKNLMSDKARILKSDGSNISKLFKHQITRGIHSRKESDGVDDFTFEVLQQCKAEELDELEDYWIKEYNSIEEGYNKGKAGFENRRFGIFKIVKVHYNIPFEIPGRTVIRNDILISTFKLSKSGMIMWLYFRMHKDGEEMEYAPSIVIQKAKGGISENSVRAGFQELEKKWIPY